MTLSIIAAMDKNRVIGKKGTIPWHLPADFEHFKTLTMGHPVIMGEKTYHSIGKPLPGRTNIILSYEGKSFPECLTANTLEEAITLGYKENDTVYVIGGGQVYRLAMPLANRLDITYVDTEIDEGDTFFPEIDAENGWKEISREKHSADEKNAYAMEFVSYERR